MNSLFAFTFGKNRGYNEAAQFPTYIHGFLNSGFNRIFFTRIIKFIFQINLSVFNLEFHLEKDQREH